MKNLWKKNIYKWIKFDSILEKDRFIELEYMNKSWIISELKLQPEFILQESFKIENPDKKSWIQSFSSIKYTADFSYRIWTDELITIEEVKWSEYQVKKDIAYNIRKRLFLKKYWNDFIFYENY